MGGFIFNYDGGTETLVESGFPHFAHFDWYRVDADRALGLAWGGSDCLAFLVDHSGGPGALAVGATVSLSVGGDRPNVTKLTDTGDWLYFDDGFGTMTRLTLSGTTITVGADVVTTSEWFYDDPTVPPALWEGHATPVPDSLVAIALDAGAGHADRMGIDLDHVLVPGVLSWTGSTEPDDAVRRAYVVDLTTGAPSAAFATTPLLSDHCAGQVDPGEAYWWAWDTWPTDGSAPSGLHLVLVSSDGSSCSVTDVTGYSFGGNTDLVAHFADVTLGLATDGKWWLFAAENAQIEPLWTPSTPFTQRIRNVQVDGATATAVDYISEQSVGGTYFPNVAVTDGCSSIDGGFLASNTGRWSWEVSDEHTRAEANGLSFSYYEVDAPHQTGGGAYIGTGGDKRLLYLWRHSLSGLPVDIYVAAFVETPIPPTPLFIPSTTDACTRERVTFDAEDEATGFASDAVTHDSYWHPILEYRWEWDDGTADVFTTDPVTMHAYRSPSTTHSAGSQTADAETEFPSLIGDVGYYLPLLLVRNSVGWSFSEGGWLIEVDECNPPQRQIPRDDGLAMSSLRSYPPVTSVQLGLRRGPGAIR